MAYSGCNMQGVASHNNYLFMFTCAVCWINTLIYFFEGSAGLATRYGLDGPGFESLGARFSAPIQTEPGAHPAFSTRVSGLSRGERGRGVTMTTHSHIVPRLKKE